MAGMVILDKARALDRVVSMAIRIDVPEQFVRETRAERNSAWRDGLFTPSPVVDGAEAAEEAAAPPAATGWAA
jgi:hypothetical protein